MHYGRWLRFGDPLQACANPVAGGFKLCQACKKVKAEGDFATKPYGDGKRTRASHCKACSRTEQVQYRREHGGRVNANAREKYALDPRQKKASKAAYWERNREQLIIRSRDRYRLTAADRPEIYRAARARRKQRIKARMDAMDRAMSVAYRMAIRADPCFYCGARVAGDMNDEHFFPLAHGGSDHWWNLVRACGPCNRRKHARCGTWFILRRGAVDEPQRPAAVA